MRDTSNSPLSSWAENQGKNSKKICNKQQVPSTAPAKIKSKAASNEHSGNNLKQLRASNGKGNQGKAIISKGGQSSPIFSKENQVGAISSKAKQFSASEVRKNQQGGAISSKEKAQEGAIFSNNAEQFSARISNNQQAHSVCLQKTIVKVAPQKRPSLDTYRITSELSSDEDEIEFNQAAEYNQQKLKRRARKKFFGRAKAARLAHLYSPLEEKYWEAYRCSDMIIQQDGKVRSHFCKHRHCEICNNIRTAHYIEKYMPTLETWKDKVFVTLTVKNPNRENLQQTLNDMHEHFTKIKDSERKAGRKLVGLRKLEITYNRREKTFHPHFHLVLEHALSAEHIILKWMKKFNPDVKPKLLKKIRKLIQLEVERCTNPKKYISLGEPYDSVRKGLIADPQFQDWRPADQNACMELFKYVTKLTSSSKNDKVIDLVALDQIYQSIRGRRIFQTFGFIAHEQVPAPENEEAPEEDYQEPATFEWLQEHHDWVCRETGEPLSGYEPTAWDLEKPKYLK